MNRATENMINYVLKLTIDCLYFDFDKVIDIKFWKNLDLEEQGSLLYYYKLNHCK